MGTEQNDSPVSMIYSTMAEAMIPISVAETVLSNNEANNGILLYL